MRRFTAQPPRGSGKIDNPDPRSPFPRMAGRCGVDHEPRACRPPPRRADHGESKKCCGGPKKTEGRG
uniref:Uncharacterized protein n=1 Tax=Arundo donax TaxID=35708 RepID=A0A0A9G067_ARUDO